MLKLHFLRLLHKKNGRGKIQSYGPTSNIIILFFNVLKNGYPIAEIML